MGKWISFLVLAGNMLVLASAREIRVTSSACSDFYDMDDVGEDVYLEYSGNRLNKDECNVQFQNFRTFEKQICVKPQKINLSCSTKVEYFRHFISEYLDPAKQFTCGQASFDEWCGPTRTNRLYIVFRTSSSSSSDNIRLHIYLKYLPGKPDTYDSDYSSSSSTGLLVGLVVGGVVFLIIITGLIIACKVAQQRRLAMPQTPYVVQTTAVSSNQPGYHSASQPSYQPPPQAPFQPGMQGSYQLHPMQSAYPANTQQSYNMGTSYQPVPQVEHGRHSPANFPQPTAPPVGNTEPPPSYDSVTK